MDYWVQTNEDMNPVRVENLSDAEAQGIVKLLQVLASGGELVFIRDCKYEETLFDNYDEWVASNGSESNYPTVTVCFNYNGARHTMVSGKLGSSTFVRDLISAMRSDDDFAVAMADMVNPGLANQVWEDTTYEYIAINAVDWFKADYGEWKSLKDRGREDSDFWSFISDDESIEVLS